MRTVARTVRTWLAPSAGCCLVYLLLADTTQGPELGVAAFCAIVVGPATSVALRGRKRVRVTASMLARVPLAIPALVSDSLRICLALLGGLLRGRPPAGRLRIEPYGATSEANPEDRGRRLLTQWGASLGANRYVIGIDNERRLLIAHELLTSDRRLDPLRLG